LATEDADAAVNLVDAVYKRIARKHGPRTTEVGTAHKDGGAAEVAATVVATARGLACTRVARLAAAANDPAGATVVGVGLNVYTGAAADDLSARAGAERVSLELGAGGICGVTIVDPLIANVRDGGPAVQRLDLL